jgi:hypothetical protein
VLAKIKKQEKKVVKKSRKSTNQSLKYLQPKAGRLSIAGSIHRTHFHLNETDSLKGSSTHCQVVYCLALKKDRKFKFGNAYNY